MCLVDLAGSEKFDESYKDEGGKINASLLALGKVRRAGGRARRVDAGGCQWTRVDVCVVRMAGRGFLCEPRTASDWPRSQDKACLLVELCSSLASAPRSTCHPQVLTALKEGDNHVPFRDSMLTQMLRDSLEGTCMTRLLACLNPGTNTFNETKNVLVYVQRATEVRAVTSDHYVERS